MGSPWSLIIRDWMTESSGKVRAPKQTVWGFLRAHTIQPMMAKKLLPVVSKDGRHSEDERD